MPGPTGPIVWDPTAPVGATTPMSEVDDEIRDMKTRLSTMVEVSHEGFAETRAGQHKVGTARAIMDIEANILLLDPVDDYGEGYIAYATDTKKEYISDGAAWVLRGGKSYSVHGIATVAMEGITAARTWQDITGATVTVNLPTDGASYQLDVVGHFNLYVRKTESAQIYGVGQIVEDVAGGGFDPAGTKTNHFYVNQGTSGDNFYAQAGVSASYLNGGLVGNGDTHILKLQFAGNYYDYPTSGIDWVAANPDINMGGSVGVVQSYSSIIVTVSPEAT